MSNWESYNPGLFVTIESFVTEICNREFLSWEILQLGNFLIGNFVSCETLYPVGIFVNWELCN